MVKIFEYTTNNGMTVFFLFSPNPSVILLELATLPKGNSHCWWQADNRMLR